VYVVAVPVQVVCCDCGNHPMRVKNSAPKEYRSTLHALPMGSVWSPYSLSLHMLTSDKVSFWKQVFAWGSRMLCPSSWIMTLMLMVLIHVTNPGMYPRPPHQHPEFSGRMIVMFVAHVVSAAAPTADLAAVSIAL